MSLDLTGGMVFIGAPGAGKGTQAKLVVEAHDVLHISTGDMLREHRTAGTELGREAQVFMDRGDLVPDGVMIAMVVERIQRSDAAKAWILDGFPRTPPPGGGVGRISLGVRDGTASRHLLPGAPR